MNMTFLDIIVPGQSRRPRIPRRVIDTAEQVKKEVADTAVHARLVWQGLEKTRGQCLRCQRPKESGKSYGRKWQVVRTQVPNRMDAQSHSCSSRENLNKQTVPAHEAMVVVAIVYLVPVLGRMFAPSIINN